MKQTVSHLDNCKMGPKAGSFYRIKNKEEKLKIPYWLGPHSHLVWGEKEQGDEWHLGLVTGYSAWFWASAAFTGA